MSNRRHSPVNPASIPMATESALHSEAGYASANFVKFTPAFTAPTPQDDMPASAVAEQLLMLQVAACPELCPLPPCSAKTALVHSEVAHIELLHNWGPAKSSRLLPKPRAIRVLDPEDDTFQSQTHHCDGERQLQLTAPAESRRVVLGPEWAMCQDVLWSSNPSWCNGSGKGSANRTS